VDLLTLDNLADARATSPEEKLRQALELMAAGFRLERAALRERHRDASEEEIARLFEEWLAADE